MTSRTAKSEISMEPMTLKIRDFFTNEILYVWAGYVKISKEFDVKQRSYNQTSPG